MRKYIVIGNWKMNGSLQQVNSLLQDLIPMLADVDTVAECVICPPSIYIPEASEKIKSTNIRIGGQNCANQSNPAFTGEISAVMLRDFGCEYVIIGHSERRSLLKEGDQEIAAKFGLALNAGLLPILCVGESKEDMLAGRGFKVVEQQLQSVLQVVGIAAFSQAIIAYEPVWAIGTGNTATPEQAQNMHQGIRAKLAKLDANVAASVRIVYGGSVNSNNAETLFRQADIDGALVGGASLKAQDFSDICHAAMRMAR